MHIPSVDIKYKIMSFLHLKAREPSEVEEGSAEKRTVATGVYTHWAGLIVFFAVSQLGIQERTVVKYLSFTLFRLQFYFVVLMPLL